MLLGRIETLIEEHTQRAAPAGSIALFGEPRHPAVRIIGYQPAKREIGQRRDERAFDLRPGIRWAYDYR